MDMQLAISRTRITAIDLDIQAIDVRPCPLLVACPEAERNLDLETCVTDDETPRAQQEVAIKNLDSPGDKGPGNRFGKEGVRQAGNECGAASTQHSNAHSHVASLAPEDDDIFGRRRLGGYIGGLGYFSHWISPLVNALLGRLCDFCHTV